MGVLYEHWRTDTNTCFYVGASWHNPETRPYEMKGRHENHIKVQEEVKNNGGHIDVRIIDCEGLTDLELGNLEELQISYWKEFLGDGLVNIAKGGWGGLGFNWTEEMRSEQREKMLLIYSTDEGIRSIEQMKRSKIEFYASPDGLEWRKSQGERKTAFYATPEGKVVKEQIRESLVEHYKDEMNRAKNSERVKAACSTEESRAANSLRAIKFYETPKGKEKAKSHAESISLVSKEVAQKILDYVGTNADCARELNAPKTTVYNIRSRRAWKHLTPTAKG